uniref:ATP-dependent Zn protease n=1 Tax=Apple proliferation phytoplasma TaxID=37692 RepID=M1X0U5_APPPP|nr:ATP-dependent Zn protease [Candidatus Phytoplasma mali]CCH80602.1 ATP-dependent Zn protease [Candidatus Phytoplasma mali]
MNLKKEERNKKINFYFYIISKILSFIVNLLFIVAIIIFLYQFNNNNPLMNNNEVSWVEKHLVKDETNNLDNIQGYEYVKTEMDKLVEFAKGNRDESTIERGILLYGPPGTGKTFLVKALAGSVKKYADFYYFSASSFQEKYVGVGAARIRSVFELAKKKSIEDKKKTYFIFVDEIDALGKDRVFDDNSKNDSVLNELLVQLDGFHDNNNQNEPKVVFIASTNREKFLDEALTRSGRLGKKIKVDFPDKIMIKKIIEYFIEKDDGIIKEIFSKLKNEKDYSTKIEDLSSLMVKLKFTPAQIKSLFKNFKDLLLKEVENSKNLTLVEIIDKIFESIDTVIFGPKNSSALENNDKKILIFHELGHAFFALINEHRVQRISLEQRGPVQGYTMNVPKNKNILKNKTDFLQEIKIALGGRIFEEIFYGSENITLGSANDFQQAYQIAYSMVADLGMSVNQQERDKLIEDFSKISKKHQNSEPLIANNESIKEFSKNLKLGSGFEDIKNIVLQNKNYDSNIRPSVMEIISFCYFQNILDFYKKIMNVSSTSNTNNQENNNDEIIQQFENDFESKKKEINQKVINIDSINLNEQQIEEILKNILI